MSYMLYSDTASTDLLRIFADSCNALARYGYKTGVNEDSDIIKESFRTAYVVRRILEQRGYAHIVTESHKRRDETIYIVARPDVHDNDAGLVEISLLCYVNNSSREQAVALINEWVQPEKPPLSEGMIRAWLRNIIYMATRLLEGKAMGETDQIAYTEIIQNRIDISASQDGNTGEIQRNRSHTRIGISVPYRGAKIEHSESISAPMGVDQLTAERAATGLLMSVARTARNEYAKRYPETVG